MLTTISFFPSPSKSPTDTHLTPNGISSFFQNSFFFITNALNWGSSSIGKGPFGGTLSIAVRLAIELLFGSVTSSAVNSVLSFDGEVLTTKKLVILKALPILAAISLLFSFGCSFNILSTSPPETIVNLPVSSRASANWSMINIFVSGVAGITAAFILPAVSLTLSPSFILSFSPPANMPMDDSCSTAFSSIYPISSSCLPSSSFVTG